MGSGPRESAAERSRGLEVEGPRRGARARPKPALGRLRRPEEEGEEEPEGKPARARLTRGGPGRRTRVGTTGPRAARNRRSERGTGGTRSLHSARPPRAPGAPLGRNTRVPSETRTRRARGGEPGRHRRWPAGPTRSASPPPGSGPGHPQLRRRQPHRPLLPTQGRTATRPLSPYPGDFRTCSSTW